MSDTDPVSPSSELAQAVEAFTRELAHDVRTPLSSIAGYADLLRHQLGAADAEVAMIVDRIVVNARAAADLVDEAVNRARARASAEGDGQQG